MSVRVRLTRVGAKKNAMWRVVVADQRSPRDGRFIEMIGHYNPQTDPSQIVIDRERLDHWLERGAEPSDTVRKLMRAPNSETAAPARAPAPAEEAEADDAPGKSAEAAQTEAPAESAEPTADAESQSAPAPAGSEASTEADEASAEVPAGTDAEGDDAPADDTEPG